MATNQVIHGSNRVVENPNRYKLNAVSGQANTYDLEKVPGIITEVGTPYSKAILDKIDNVLSYLTPSVEKVELIVPTPVTSNVAYKNISETLNENVIIDSMNVNYEKYTGTNLNPSLKVHAENSNIILYGAATSTNKVGMYVQESGYTRYTNTYFDDFFKNRTTTNYTLNFRLYSKSQILYMDYDFKGSVSCTYHYYYMNSSDLNIEFYTSNNGTDWTLIGTGSKGTEYTINISNARYFRIKNYNTTVFSMYRSYFTNLTGIVDMIVNQNQFTLDNNTSFTNNQRVLIGTPQPPQIILSNPQKLEEKTWQINGTNTTLTSNDNITITTTRGNSNLIDFIDGDISTRYTFATPQTESTNVIIDLLTDKAISSLQLYINNVTNYANKLYYSSNGTTWKEFYDYSSQQTGTNWTETINNTLIARYIKIESTNNSASYTTTSFYEIKCTINDYTITSGLDLDGVTSNTLNGIDIPTLLQPSTKYELIYNENSNKFELGGLKTLFDITLTEAVNQVDLTGLASMLKQNKLYCLIVSGAISESSNTGIWLGNGEVMTGNSTRCFSPIVFSVDILNNVYISGIKNTASYGLFYRIVNDYENIKLVTGTFNVGTRIIIKEVA